MTDLSQLKTTPLTAWHAENGGKMVEFAGFQMPVQYTGVLAEHANVRDKVGLFDITHMGEIFVTGPGAEAWLDGLVTNRVTGGKVGKVVYTAMCRPGGGVLDDMLIYRLGEIEWLVVCNAANHAKIAGWLAEQPRPDDVDLDDRSDDTALIAVQGPDSRDLICRLEQLAPVIDRIGEMGFYSAFTLDGPGGRWIVSRTGYTGEHGYELYLPNADTLAVWEELLSKGEDVGVQPIGLAARDTLRLEVGYCLYGHELAEDITPLEAGIGWAVKLKKESFMGLDALRDQKAAGVPRKIVCLELDDRGIARQDAPVLSAGRPVGHVTSGTFSPTLQRAIALALVESDTPDTDLAVDVRGRVIPCHKVAYPFVKARTKGDPQADRS